MRQASTSARLARLSGVLTALLALAVVAMAIVLNRDPDYAEDSSLPGMLADLTIAFSFALVGVFVSIKRPDNIVGWAMVLSGNGMMIGGLVGAYADLALFAEPQRNLPAGAAAAMIGIVSWTPLMAGVFLLLVYFPTGEASSKRWRTLTKAVLIGFVLISIGIATNPGKLDAPYDAYDNSLAFPGSAILVVVAIPTIVFCLLSVVAAAINLVIRFRRSRGDEREQYKWLALAVTLLVLAMPFSAAVNYNGIPGALFTLALICLPTSVGIAVLRYRLYDIDRIINRTLVYALLTSMLALVYFGLVVSLQAVLQSLSGGSNLAIALTTLLVAALFLPARARIQSVVDRRFNRRSYDAARTVEAFALRLRQQIDLDTLRYELLSVVDETMQPEQASLWLRTPEAGR